MANLPSQMMANAIRALAMDAVEAAKSGHPGMPMGMADAATVLFANHLKFDISQPNWPDRDRFVLSAGHGSMLLYALLYLTGYKDTTLDALRNFRQLGSATAGHPEYGHAAGIETTTGPLGQRHCQCGRDGDGRNPSARQIHRQVGKPPHLCYRRGWLFDGGGQPCAASMAGHFQLGNLIVLFDDNGISIDGKTELAVSDDITARFEAYGWQVLACDGHDMAAVDKAIIAAKAEQGKPSLIRCKTEIGKGAPTMAGTSKVHGAPLGADEIAGTRAALNRPYAPFEIPEDILKEWRKIGQNGQQARQKWGRTVKRRAAKNRFEAALSGDISAASDTAIGKMKTDLAANPQKLASRVASQKTIEALVAETDCLFGGSADLTGSNNTKAADQDIYSAQNPTGHYIHYGCANMVWPPR